MIFLENSPPFYESLSKFLINLNNLAWILWKCQQSIYKISKLETLALISRRKEFRK